MLSWRGRNQRLAGSQIYSVGSFIRRSVSKNPGPCTRIQCQTYSNEAGKQRYYEQQAVTAPLNREAHVVRRDFVEYTHSIRLHEVERDASPSVFVLQAAYVTFCKRIGWNCTGKFQKTPFTRIVVVL